MAAIQGEFGLHELAVEDAHQAHQRPKLEEYGDGLFVVLRTVRWDAREACDRARRDARVRGRRYVVSIRHGDTGSYAGARAAARPRLGICARGRASCSTR